ncbi:hypothetical protein ACFL42_03495 [Candidatus Omnitrophota bacterium]
MRIRPSVIGMILLVTVFAVSIARVSGAQEEETEEAKVKGNLIFDVFIKTLKFDDIKQTVTLTSDDTYEGKIKIDGKSGSDVRRVLYSMDKGNSWRVALGFGGKGADTWMIRFTPKENKLHYITIKPYDIRQNAGDELTIKLFYDSRPHRDIVSSMVEELESFYNEKDLDGFLSLVDTGNFPELDKFKEGLADTFENFGNLELDLRVRKVSVVSDSASVRINWERTWEDESKLEGWGAVLQFQRKPVWRLLGVSAKSIFIRGFGIVSVRLRKT